MPVAISPSDVFMFVILVVLVLVVQLMALTLPTEADKGTTAADDGPCEEDTGRTMPLDATPQP